MPRSVGGGCRAGPRRRSRTPTAAAAQSPPRRRVRRRRPAASAAPGSRAAEAPWGDPRVRCCDAVSWRRCRDVVTTHCAQNRRARRRPGVRVRVRVRRNAGAPAAGPLCPGVATRRGARGVLGGERLRGVRGRVHQVGRAGGVALTQAAAGQAGVHDVSRPAAGQRCRHRRVLGVRDPPPSNVVRAALLVEVHAGVGVVVKPGGGIVNPPCRTAGWGSHVARRGTRAACRLRLAS